MWSTASAWEPVDGSPERQIGELGWHTDYVSAYRQAREEKKQLVIFFHDPRQPQVADIYTRDVLASPELLNSLSGMVRAILPLNATLPSRDAAGNPGTPTLLVANPAFKYLQKRQGLVIIDLVNPKDSFHGQVVSAHPFGAGRYYTTGSTRIVLDLPRATATQRALVYAVRIHPEAPQSTRGKAHPLLFKQAAHHSALMAQYGSVGHHDWGTRSSIISSAVGSSPSEVAASSYSGDNLIDAAKECVSMWRGSSVHWIMVNAAQGTYGYDMVKAPSGQWYATGIFTGQ
jgi:hypothetical protein